jgi:hypothetical protein
MPYLQIKVVQYWFRVCVFPDLADFFKKICNTKTLFPCWFDTESESRIDGFSAI